MELNDKQSYIANFNCTFGEKNKPMLNYFFEALLPALLEEKEDKSGFVFENVEINLVKGEFVLAGLLVRRTILEIKSIYKNGELVRTDESYPSDPYSYFLINLKNHRMVLVKNQKGSPTLVNFAKAVRERLNKYIIEKNEVLEESEKIPEAHLNVVAIPFEESIKEALGKVKKINNVILRFYPLNEDIIDNETANDLLKSLEDLGCNSANLTYNSPDNKDSVAQVIEETKGLMRPTIRVEYDNGSKVTLKDGAFTEVMNIPVDESESFGKNIDTISGKVINKKEFNETSEGNKKIYQKYFTQIEQWYNRNFK